ncbi:MAG: hypothetical protein P4L99_01935 [Chthoniobacter sp.]|nr:hypothetical protein [Chthoniobacter sp.]
MLFTGERIPSYSYMILNAWRRIFDLPVERFPVTDAERAETAEWIDREVLLKFALGTTVEREKAEKIENEERTPAYTTLCDLLKGAPPSDPEELLSYRRSVRDAGDAARQANRAYHAARRKANRTERKYLEIWDFLVKEEPEGIGLLHEKYGSMDPHEFRRSWTVRHPANDSTVTS